MTATRRPPSIPGTAFGTSWAGLGLGAIAGMALASRLHPQSELGQPGRLESYYAALLAATAVGMALGALAGGVYARRRGG